ncbi:hypothetical protein ACFFSY_20735 [Paenibacillus aurantiacus]|uniref:Uncharacterized protein n=1 Tax=Paenibacillus aurantiacus TaxID=1936118 RepID=A0ABV5KT03_9BACL
MSFSNYLTPEELRALLIEEASDLVNAMTSSSPAPSDGYSVRLTLSQRIEKLEGEVARLNEILTALQQAAATEGSQPSSPPEDDWAAAAIDYDESTLQAQPSPAAVSPESNAGAVELDTGSAQQERDPELAFIIRQALTRSTPPDALESSPLSEDPTSVQPETEPLSDDSNSAELELELLSENQTGAQPEPELLVEDLSGVKFELEPLSADPSSTQPESEPFAADLSGATPESNPLTADLLSAPTESDPALQSAMQAEDAANDLEAEQADEDLAEPHTEAEEASTMPTQTIGTNDSAETLSISWRYRDNVSLTPRSQRHPKSQSWLAKLGSRWRRS